MSIAVAAKKKESVAVVVIGIVLLIGALIATILLLVPSSLSGFIMGFQNYTPAKGLFNSPWVGLKNYRAIFDLPAFQTGLSSTLTHAFFSAMLLFLSSLVTGYLLLAVGKIRWLRHGLCTLLLLPLIVPGDLLVQVFVRMRLYAAPANAATALLIAAVCTIRYVGLPALLVSAAIARGKRTWAVPLLAGGTASVVVFALLGRFDFSFMRQMPPTLYQVLGLDTVVFRSTFMNMQIGIGTAVSTFLALLTGILTLLAALPVGLMVGRLFPKGAAAEEGRSTDRLLTLIIPGGAALLAAVVLVVLAIPGVTSGELSAYANLPGYIIAAFFTAAVNTVLCYCLARPAACSGRAGKIIMACLLVVLTAITVDGAQVSFGEYTFFRSIGAVNSWFAIVLSGIGMVWGVWPLIAAAKAMGIRDNMDWYRRMWKPALALFAVQAALLMNNSTTSVIYQSRKDLLHPLVLAAQQTNAGGLMNLALLTLCTLAVPVVLLLIVRTAFREEESLGVFLPGK